MGAMVEAKGLVKRCGAFTAVDGIDVASGLETAGLLVRRSTLEDVFLHLTGRTLVD